MSFFNITTKLFFFSVFSFLLLGPLNVSAGYNDGLKGFAWSSNIGWISFNCTDLEICETSNYGVTTESGGDLSGYAWSPSVGWIDFGYFDDNPDSSFPKANYASGRLTGFAKILSFEEAEDGLETRHSGVISLNDTSSGDRHGVIEASGQNPYNKLVNFAWDSETAGWISFNCSDLSICSTSEYSVILEPFFVSLIPSLVTNAENKSLYNSELSFSWNINSPNGNTVNCANTLGNESWRDLSIGTGNLTGTDVSVGQLTETTTFKLLCTDQTTNKKVERNIKVYIKSAPPSITLSSSSNNVGDSNNPPVITWEITNVRSCNVAGASVVQTGDSILSNTKVNSLKAAMVDTVDGNATGTITTDLISGTGNTLRIQGCEAFSTEDYPGGINSNTISISYKELVVDFSFLDPETDEEITLDKLNYGDLIKINLATLYASSCTVPTGDDYDENDTSWVNYTTDTVPDDESKPETIGNQPIGVQATWESSRVYTEGAEEINFYIECTPTELIGNTNIIKNLTTTPRKAPRFIEI